MNSKMKNDTVQDALNAYAEAYRNLLLFVEKNRSIQYDLWDAVEVERDRADAEHRRRWVKSQPDVPPADVWEKPGLMAPPRRKPPFQEDTF